MKNFVYRGSVFLIHEVNTIEEYLKLEEKYIMMSKVFYIKEAGVFMLRDKVIACGDYEHVVVLPEAEPLKELKTKTKTEAKNEKPQEIAMELKVPTAEELDNYFSSIGLKDFEEIF